MRAGVEPVSRSRIAKSLLRCGPNIGRRGSEPIVVALQSPLIELQKLLSFGSPTLRRAMVNESASNLLAQLIVIVTGVEQMKMPSSVDVFRGSNRMIGGEQQKQEFAVLFGHC